MVQMRKVALGEIFKDVNYGFIDSLRAFFGIKKKETGQDFSDMQGKDRLGPTNVFESLGISHIAVTLSLVLLILLALLTTYACSKYLKCCKKIKKSLVRKLSWNLLIGYLNVSWIKICFSAALGSSMLLYEEDASTTTICCVIFLILFTVSLPYAYVIVLKKHFDELDDQKTKDKIGSLYKGLKLQKLIQLNNKEVTPKRLNYVVFYPAVFTTRRTAFVMLTVFMIKYPCQQIMIHQLVTNMYIFYLAIWRDGLFLSKIDQTLQVTNELFCMFAVIVLTQSMRIDLRNVE